MLLLASATFCHLAATTVDICHFWHLLLLAPITFYKFYFRQFPIMVMLLLVGATFDRFHFWKQPFLILLLLAGITFWQICYLFWQLPLLTNATFDSSPFVTFDSCYFWHVLRLTAAFFGNCYYWQLSFWQIPHFTFSTNATFDSCQSFLTDVHVYT